MGQMQDFHNSSTQNHQQKSQNQFSSKPDKVSKSDYIDFEEIK
jgi:hypothetical protein